MIYIGDKLQVGVKQQSLTRYSINDQ